MAVRLLPPAPAGKSSSLKSDDELYGNLSRMEAAGASKEEMKAYHNRYKPPTPEELRISGLYSVPVENQRNPEKAGLVGMLNQKVARGIESSRDPSVLADSIAGIAGPMGLVRKMGPAFMAGTGQKVTALGKEGAKAAWTTAKEVGGAGKRIISDPLGSIMHPIRSTIDAVTSVSAPEFIKSRLAKIVLTSNKARELGAERVNEVAGKNLNAEWFAEQAIKKKDLANAAIETSNKAMAKAVEVNNATVKGSATATLGRLTGKQATEAAGKKKVTAFQAAKDELNLPGRVKRAEEEQAKFVKKGEIKQEERLAKEARKGAADDATEDRLWEKGMGGGVRESERFANKTTEVLEDLLNNSDEVKASPALTAQLKDMLKKVKTTKVPSPFYETKGRGVSVGALDAQRKRVGENIGKLAEKGGISKHIAGRLYGALYEDLGDIPGLRKAIDASKSKFAGKLKEEILEGATSVTKSGTVKVAPNKALNTLRGAKGRRLANMNDRGAAGEGFEQALIAEAAGGIPQAPKGLAAKIRGRQDLARGEGVLERAGGGKYNLSVTPERSAQIKAGIEAGTTPSTKGKLVSNAELEELLQKPKGPLAEKEGYTELQAMLQEPGKISTVPDYVPDLGSPYNPIIGPTPGQFIRFSFIKNLMDKIPKYTIEKFGLDRLIKVAEGGGDDASAAFKRIDEILKTQAESTLRSPRYVPGAVGFGMKRSMEEDEERRR